MLYIILMKIIFTLHAEKQILERKFEKVWIEETIKTPDEIKRKGEKYYARKKLNGFTLKVVYAKEKYIKIITTYMVRP